MIHGLPHAMVVESRSRRRGFENFLSTLSVNMQQTECASDGCRVRRKTVGCRPLADNAAEADGRIVRGLRLALTTRCPNVHEPDDILRERFSQVA